MSETARSGSGSFRPFCEKFIGRLSPRVGGALRKKRITLISKMQGLPSARARTQWEKRISFCRIPFDIGAYYGGEH